MGFLCFLLCNNLNSNLRTTRVVCYHQHTWLRASRLNQSLFGCNLHLCRLTRLQFLLVQRNLQAHSEHLKVLDVEYSLAIVAYDNFALQLLLSVESTKIKLRCRQIQSWSIGELRRCEVVELRQKNSRNTQLLLTTYTIARLSHSRSFAFEDSAWT